MYGYSANAETFAFILFGIIGLTIIFLIFWKVKKLIAKIICLAFVIIMLMTSWGVGREPMTETINRLFNTINITRAQTTSSIDGITKNLNNIR